VKWQLKCQNNGGRRNCPLLGNSSINIYENSGNGCSSNSRGTIEIGVIYVVHVDGIKQEIMSLGLAGKYTTLE
jgi:hypothetical protein